MLRSDVGAALVNRTSCDGTKLACFPISRSGLKGLNGTVGQGKFLSISLEAALRRLIHCILHFRGCPQHLLGEHSVALRPGDKPETAEWHDLGSLNSKTHISSNNSFLINLTHQSIEHYYVSLQLSTSLVHLNS